MKKILSVLALIGLTLSLSSPVHASIVCCKTAPLSNSYSGCMKDGSSTMNCATGYAEGLCIGTSGCVTRKALGEETWEEMSARDENTSSDFVDTYYGYRNGTNKSGSGRTVAALARLDACWTGGNTDTNTLSNRSGCYAACDNGTTNIACNGLTGAESCYSRCDAAYSSQ